MKQPSDKPWSNAMKIALVVLSAIGTLICVGSVATVVRTWRVDGTVETRFVVGAIAGGVWAVFTLWLARHPEWKRHLVEKF